jgi:hypothetical protein
MTSIILITGILVMVFTRATQMVQKKIMPRKEK